MLEVTLLVTQAEHGELEGDCSVVRKGIEPASYNNVS